MDELAARRAQDDVTDLIPTAFPPEVIEAVKARFPTTELRQIVTEEGGAIICKAPSRGEYKRFRSMVVDPNQRAMALETLVFGCCVHPPTAELSAMLERRPGWAEVWGDKLAGWSGSGQEATEKKL